MNTNLMIILSTILVITSGVSLAAFMSTLGGYNVSTPQNLKFPVLLDNDNEAPDIDLKSMGHGT